MDLITLEKPLIYYGLMRITLNIGVWKMHPGWVILMVGDMTLSTLKISIGHLITYVTR
jgi:hypothetical protein